MNQQSFWNRRIPTLFGVIILFIGVAITGFLVREGVIFRGLAAPENTPTDVTISNITDSSFSVSYLTSDRVLGSMTVNENADGAPQIVTIDVRDQKSGKPQAYIAHMITVRNLKPKTTYQFTITSGEENFKKSGDLSFVVTTGTKLQPPTTQRHITGTVVTSQGDPPDGALVYAKSSNSQTLSTLVRPDGTYTLPLSELRNTNGTNYLSVTPESVLSLTVNSLLGTSSLKLRLDRGSKVPRITLPNNYNFAYEDDLPDASVTSSESAVIEFPQPSLDGNETAAGNVSILSPKAQTSYSDRRPVFRGKTAPNTEVEITISNEEDIQINVISDRRGNWTFRPKSPLTPGQQLVTIQTQDEFGIAKTLSQEFTILAEGSQFTEPSVAPPTPTPTKKTTPTPTPTKTQPTRSPTRSIQAPTATPTLALIPTMTEAPKPLPTMTQVPTAAPTGAMVTTIPVSTSPQPSIPPTGSASGIMYAIIGALIAGIGLFLFLLSRGGASL